MTRSITINHVAKAIETVTRRPLPRVPLTEKTCFEDVDLDPLDRLEIVNHLEDELSQTIPDNAEDAETFGEFLEICNAESD